MTRKHIKPLSLYLILGLTLNLYAYKIGQAACPTYTQGQLQTVTKVFDGDTFVLADNTKVRFAGINTPELGYNQKPNETGAKAAKNFLQRILIANRMQVYIKPATKPQDHYKRLIAHIYTQSGHSIQEQMLESGVALGYTWPPNLENLKCYRAAEAKASKQKLGLWKKPAKATFDLTREHRKFLRVQGRVQNVKRTRKSVWINMDGNFSLRVAHQNFRYFKNFDFQNLVNRKIEVRGYVYQYRRRPTMRIRHPANISLL